MQTIFKGFEFNVKKAILEYCQQNRIPNGLLMSQHYSVHDVRPLFECYINDKGNLIISKNEFRFYLTDKLYQKLYENNCRERKALFPVDYDFTNPYANTAVEVVDLKYPEIKARIDTQRYHYPNELKSIYVRNQKIVITPDRKIYFVNGRKIRRVNNKELNWIGGSFIRQSITNPRCSFLTRWNAVTTAIVGRQYLVTSNKPINNMTNFPSADYYFQDLFWVQENQLKAYYDAIGNYFPLLPYLRYARKGNRINALSDPNLVPNYVKKEFLDPNARNAVNGCYDHPDKNQRMLYGYGVCRRLKITDINVIRKFLTMYKSISDYDIYSGYSFKGITHYYKYLKQYYEGKVKNIELLLANRLCYNSTDYDTTHKYVDSLNMFNEALDIRKKHPEKKFKALPMEYLIKHSLKDIHDTLSTIIRDDKLALNFKEFDMGKRNKYERDVNGYKFLMPENNMELSRLSDIMKNCVAGYDWRIERGESIIVYATDNDDVINYIKNGEGDIKYLTTKMENDEILSPACIELNEKLKVQEECNPGIIDLYLPNYNNPCNFVNYIKEKCDNTDLILRQCYARHNKHVDEKNPNLDEACQKYFTNIGVVRVENRYNF